MQHVTRQEIFKAAASRIRQEFRELVTVPHSGLRGTEAEQILRQFLNAHLPKRFSASSGFVIDREDSISPQTDVVVYDALNCPVYRASESAGIFPNDNVAAVIEVKSRLDKEQLESAAASIERVKRLRKTPELAPLGNKSDVTFGCLFAYESSISLSKLREHYANLLNGQPLGFHIDLIVVLDRGIVSWLTSLRERTNWSQSFLHGAGGPATEGAAIALGVTELGDDTLDFFFRFLLAHLSTFRATIDHPGFDWQKTEKGAQVELQYVGSITHERDPQRREELLQLYRTEGIGKILRGSPVARGE